MHVVEPAQEAHPIKLRMRARYGSLYAGRACDPSTAQKAAETPYFYWKWHKHGEKRGQE